LKWEGEGLNEVGVNDGKVLVDVNPKFYRPAEVELLLGDSTKARDILGWQPKYTFKLMIDEMMEAALK
jgi:GDPmannose 4,6-dehydratase